MTKPPDPRTFAPLLPTAEACTAEAIRLVALRRPRSRVVAVKRLQRWLANQERVTALFDEIAAHGEQRARARMERAASASVMGEMW